MPLAVEQLQLGPIGTNCYLVRASEEAAETVVVDPGAETAAIVAALARLGLSCQGILLTHSHYDHFGALAELEAATGAPVWLPAGELDVFSNPAAYYPGIPLPPYTGASSVVSGEETVELAGISFEVTPVPGHSPGHVAYHADGCLFSGDVLFQGSVGRTDIPFGDWDLLLGSIQRLLEAYPPETIVYSGHGPATTLGTELARNPFLAELRPA